MSSPKDSQLQTSSATTDEPTRLAGHHTAGAVAAIRFVGSAEMSIAGGAALRRQFEAVVGARLRSQVRSTDVVGWADMSTLVVSMPSDNVEGAVRAAARLLKSAKDICSSSSMYPNLQPYCGLSIGAESHPGSLLTRATQLAEEAWQIHSSRPLCDAHAEEVSIGRDEELESSLGDAIRNNEMSVVYQPIYTATDQSIVAFEALVRWTSPQFGVVPPDQFIPVAEKSGAILEIGSWVLDTACKDLARYSASSGRPDVKVAVNASVHQLFDNRLSDSVEHSTRSAGITPEHVVIEITESVLADADEILPVLDYLSEMGVKLSLDDVGSGYASMGQIAALPIDWMKIDRTLTIPGRGHKWEQVLRSVVGLGRALDLEVVGEGMETQGHIDLACSVGCSMLQGFHLSIPTSMDRIINRDSGSDSGM